MSPGACRIMALQIQNFESQRCVCNLGKVWTEFSSKPPCDLEQDFSTNWLHSSGPYGTRKQTTLQPSKSGSPVQVLDSCSHPEQTPLEDFPNHKGWVDAQGLSERGPPNWFTRECIFSSLLGQLGRTLPGAFGWDRLAHWADASLFMCWVPTGMLCFLWSLHDGQQLHDEAEVKSVCCFFSMRKLDVATWSSTQGFMTACWDQAVPRGLRDKFQGVEGQVRHRLETLHTTTPTPSEQSQRPLPSTDSSFWVPQRPSWLQQSYLGNFFLLFFSLPCFSSSCLHSFSLAQVECGIKLTDWFGCKSLPFKFWLYQ